MAANSTGPDGIPPVHPSTTAASFKTPISIVLIALLLIGGWFLLRSRLPGAANTSSTFGPPDRQRVPAELAALRIHGSNTIGAALVPALAVSYLKSLGATDIHTNPINKNESDIIGSIPGQSKPFVIEVFAHGTKTAFVDLKDDKCDIGMASRKIQPEEVSLTAARGDLTSRSSEHVLGLDGVAVVVNKNNRVSGLTTDQVARIFSGAVTDWTEVGGTPGPIHVFSRDDNSGTYETFKSLVLKSASLISSAVRLEDSRELSSRVSDDSQAIGFIGLPYILNAKAIAISETEGKGAQLSKTTPLYPNRLTVATEDYPLSRRLFLYTSPNSTNTWAEKFVDFALSRFGQDVVGENGFVSQTPVVVSPECLNCPARYRKLTEGKKRMTTNFRFQTGVSTLDYKAMFDIGRVADVLADLKYAGGGVVLLGFADSVGSPEACVRVSKDRADAIATEFRMHGVNPEAVEGLGSAMPVASNDDPAGREKNRRVEIWVSQ